MTSMTMVQKREQVSIALPKVIDKSGFAPSGEVKTKVCASCGRELPLEAFPCHRLSADGRMAECKECRRRKHAPTDAAKSNPLEKFTARQLMHELNMRGYKGEITYTEVKVHKMNLKDF